MPHGNAEIVDQGFGTPFVQPTQSLRRSVNRKVAGSDPSWLMMQEVRIEDCTSDSSAEPAPWEDTMRLMPPLLELADMFNIILRRCRNSRADSDLVRGTPLQQLLLSHLMLQMCRSCMAAEGWADQALMTLH